MDTPILVILVYLISNQSNSKSFETVHNIRNYISNIQVDSNYTDEKIKIAKKVAPLLPYEYGLPFNKSIHITEKVVRVIELINFLENDESSEFTTMNLEPKERLQKIVSTIQTEVKNSRIDNLGIALDLLVNMDKYKKMFSTFGSLIGNKGSLNDSTSIIRLIDTFMDGSSPKDKEKINDMSKMLDIFKLIDTPKKEKPNEWLFLH